LSPCRADAAAIRINYRRLAGFQTHHLF